MLINIVPAHGGSGAQAAWGNAQTGKMILSCFLTDSKDEPFIMIVLYATPQYL
jgi:hypothetical protein